MHKKLTLIFLVLFTLLLGNAATGLAAEKPNIILCMADDMGWGDTGYNGHPHLKTPNLDQMSRDGVTFTRFYSAAAMCSPTRASCYTGRSPYRMGVTFAMKGCLEEEEITITHILKKAGYTTGHFGKWHLGTLSKKRGDQKRWGDFAKKPERYYCPPWDRDVDVSFVTESKVPTWNPLLEPNWTEGVADPPPGAKPYGNEYFTGPDTKVTENTLGDDSRVIVDRVVPFMKGAVKKKQPFFAAVWFHTPHSPVFAGEKYRKMYADQSVNAQHYYGCVTALDEQVGRIRAELKKLGVEKNTMLWFCSDNGPAKQGSPRHVGSAGGLSGRKLTIQEGGIRVPGLLVWPDVVKKPMQIDAPCFTGDYFATVLDALNIPLPKDREYDGISLLPLLRGERKTRNAPIGFLNANGSEAVWMDDKYKLIVRPKSVRLHDIVADKEERKDLSKELPEVTEKMRKALESWKKGVMEDLAAVNKKGQSK